MWKMARKPLLLGTVFTAVITLVVAVWSMLGRGEGGEVFVYYPVARNDLPIVVTERGNLESQVETKITCQVENVSVDRSGNYGTQIIFIVPNGAAVKEGDLLVEFDSAAIRDRLDTQELAYQKAVSAKTQAVAKYENQLIQNETAEAEAELAVELAKLELEMYTDPDNGTFRLAVEEIERQIDNAKNQSLEARAALQLAEVERSGMEELFMLGYRGKSDLDQSQLKFLQAEDRLASSINQVKTYQANRRKLTEYEKKMQELQLQGAVETAKRALRQVRNDNESLREQALAAKQEAENTELKEKERLARLKEQLANCKIYAPHGGMVVYARDRRNNTDIAEGATVRERQDILTLPDLSRMQVKTQVHEAVLDQVRPGLATAVRVDAFPNRVFNGIVEKVAVVPSSDGWFSGSVKTYETIVKIEGEVDSLKPGMTAVVNIRVDRIRDILTVPVQAVVQVDRDNWCYVNAGRGIERRDIVIGRSNEKFVHVREGLQPGDRVVLNPMDVMDERQRAQQKISPEAGVPEVPGAEESVAEQEGAATAKVAVSDSADGGDPPRRGRSEGERPRGRRGAGDDS
jgi:RND family efflux transporter MFP subunit